MLSLPGDARASDTTRNFYDRHRGARPTETLEAEGLARFIGRNTELIRADDNTP